MNYAKVIANFLVAFFTTMLAAGSLMGLSQETIMLAFLNAIFTAGLSASIEYQKQSGGKGNKHLEIALVV